MDLLHSVSCHVKRIEQFGGQKSSRMAISIHFLLQGLILCGSKRPLSSFMPRWARFELCRQGYWWLFLLGRNEMSPIGVQSLQCI